MPTGTPLENLRTLVRIPTISRADAEETDWAPFDRFIGTLPALYPAVHATLTRELVAGRTLVYRWAGRTAADATVLLAHYDVVAATDLGWEHGAFDATVTGDGDDRIVWGRGTVDNKGSLVAILEAVEAQVAGGQVPASDIYLVFGHDEETHGTGARAAARLLDERGVRPALVLDEGGAIVEGFFPGVAAPMAAIGVSEKGTTILQLVVDQAGGHASTPPRLTATVRLARAILRLNSRPFPSAFNRTTLELINSAGRNASGLLGFVYRNTWLTRGLLKTVFTRRSPEANAMTRTTQAVTMLEAGHAQNALPERAIATLNIRVAVGSSVDKAVAHVRRAVSDPLVRIEVVDGGEPMPVSPTTGQAWEILRATVESTHPGVIVAPYVQNGATDSRSFAGISRAIYRFTPFELSQDERDALHARNERIHAATFLRGIDFYRALCARL